MPGFGIISRDQPAGGKIRVVTRCPRCKTEIPHTLDHASYERWQSGEYIQRAFRGMSADEREQLVSGYCPRCWDEAFGDT